MIHEMEYLYNTLLRMDTEGEIWESKRRWVQ